MTLSNRRQFLRQTALGAAAVYGGHSGAFAAARVLAGSAQDVAGTDAALIRKLASSDQRPRHHT